MTELKGKELQDNTNLEFGSKFDRNPKKSQNVSPQGKIAKCKLSLHNVSI